MIATRCSYVALAEEGLQDELGSTRTLLDEPNLEQHYHQHGRRKLYSASGCSTNPRSNMDKWGMIRFSSFITSRPYRSMSRSKVRGPLRIDGNRPNSTSIRFKVSRSS
jgi:hypothetical protein